MHIISQSPSSVKNYSTARRYVNRRLARLEAAFVPPALILWMRGLLFRIDRWWRRRVIAGLLFREALHFGCFYQAYPGDRTGIDAYPSRAADLWSESDHLLFRTVTGWVRVPVRWCKLAPRLDGDVRMSGDFAQGVADLLNAGLLTYDWRNQCVVPTTGRWRTAPVLDGESPANTEEVAA